MMSLPQFPIFKNIELHDKDIFEDYLKNFPPYSDFNFVSLWSWNTDEKIKFSFLNENLVLELSDYVDNTPILTFIGQIKVIDTVDSLLEFAKSQGFASELKLLPKHNFANLDIREINDRYKLSEDYNNFDYILDVSALSTMSGQKLKHKRKLLNRFKKNYESSIQIKYMDINDINKHLINFYHHWSKNKSKPDLNINELHAITRLLKHYHFFNTIVMSVHLEDRLIGFTLFEELSKDWALSSFQKGDISFSGIYEFLNHRLALHLQEKGIKFVNIEQDLGVEGLRRAKMDYNPTFLKKFTISKKIN